VGSRRAWLGRGVEVGGAALRLGARGGRVLGLDGLVQVPGLRLEPHLQPLRVHLHILRAPILFFKMISKKISTFFKYFLSIH
jgi:hypothetical protein